MNDRSPESTFVRTRPTRVMIVDDDLDNGALVSRLLQSVGFAAEHFQISRR